MITREVDEQKGLTTTICSGAITVEDVIGVIDSTYEADPTPNQLWDMSAAEFSDISVGQVGEVADHTKGVVSKRAGGKTAIVSSSDLGFGLARAYQMYADSQGMQVEVGVFRTMESAKEWLMPEPTDSPD